MNARQMITITQLLGTHSVLDISEIGRWVWAHCENDWEFMISSDGKKMWYHYKEQVFTKRAHDKRWSQHAESDVASDKEVTLATGGKLI